MDEKHILDDLIELSHIAPELCSSCKYLEMELFKDVKEKWCAKTMSTVLRVWLCTIYEKIDENEGVEYDS